MFKPFAQYKNRVSVTDTLISQIEWIVIFCHISEDVRFYKGFGVLNMWIFNEFRR